LPTRDIYLKVEMIPGYSPVMPADHITPPVQYGRDCMRNPGHEDGRIPVDEVNARRLTALVYREYLDPQYLVPKPDKLVAADINEPGYAHRVPGTVIYASPGDRLRIHLKNADGSPHSFHLHGLRYGIDSDGSWPFGVQSADGRRSDEICAGQTWTYTYDVDDDMIGAWPFHDHCRNIGDNTNRGLFGGIIVLPKREQATLPKFPVPAKFFESALEIAARVRLPTALPDPVTVADPGPSAQPQPTAAGSTGPGGMSMSGMSMPGMSMPWTQMPGMSTGAMPMGPMGAQTRRSLRYSATTTAHRFDPATTPEALVPILPVFQCAPLGQGQSFTFTFTVPGTYRYVCGIHGAMMSGTVTVAAGPPSPATVQIADFSFTPPNVTVAPGDTVTWTNTASTLHSVLETGNQSITSYCFNGRSFVGNSPTIVARAGQKIRWYVFNLDLSMMWHNFHTHAQRWKFANQPIDVRSLGPAESFVVETVVPPALTLPDDIARAREPGHRPRGAKPYRLRADYLFHCHVEMHMMSGLTGLVRSIETVWLTDKQKHTLETSIGLPLDDGGNGCPSIDPNRCANSSWGRVDQVPNLPGVTFMHSLLIPNSDRVVFWGYGQQQDQVRVWDPGSGYAQPANQPLDVTADENIWSCGHAHINDTDGTILVCGGFQTGGGVTADTERRSFLFHPATNTFSATGDIHEQRFYPTTIVLPDGRIMALYGSPTANPTPISSSFEVFDPAAAGGSGAWSAATPLPFNFLWYPWTFLLPDGELFVAGPQEPARKFDYTVTPVVDDPGRQYQQVYPQRGVNMDGTAALLPLRPPNYEPRVLIAGGSSATAWSGDDGSALRTAEWIDLSMATPAWSTLPDMNIARDHMQSVLLPDGRIVVLGGTDLPPGGGPIEIFDPQDPTSGFQLGPTIAYTRTYHSGAILLRDGSVLIGGDTSPFQHGATTPNERYLPSYFFKPRPVIAAPPGGLTCGSSFTVSTPTPGAIAEVVLMRPGAVTHAFNHDQRFVGCAITGTTSSAVRAVAPPDPNHAPPGHYLLFLVDKDRVPSEGVWVRLEP
jgi:plastocyanin